MVRFSRVKAILDSAVDAWRARTGREPNLAKHGNGFGWQNRQQLLSSFAFGKQLIAAEDIGTGRGKDSNLVVALREGVLPFPQMPLDGPFLNENELNEIIAWIDGGALE
jgi:hypothetical protein